MTRSTSIPVFLISGLVAAATGCVTGDADAPMRIIGNVAPGEGCSVDSSSNTFFDDGIIDTASFWGYVFTPTVINEIAVLEGEATGPKTIYVEGANVEIEFYDTERFPAGTFDETLLSFSTPTTGALDPGGGTGAFSFEIVPVELLEAMAPILGAPVLGERPPLTTLDVRVQMFGIKGGGEVKSRFFRYPVQVCVGCLVVNRGLCANLPDGFTPSIGGACNVAQDGSIDCCTDALGAPVCPAAPPSGA